MSMAQKHFEEKQNSLSPYKLYTFQIQIDGNSEYLMFSVDAMTAVDAWLQAASRASSYNAPIVTIKLAKVER